MFVSSANLTMRLELCVAAVMCEQGEQEGAEYTALGGACICDYSSAFNTIIPSRLVSKLVDLGPSASLCKWIFDFLTGRPQVVRIGDRTSATVITNTGTPQGCVLSPLLFSLWAMVTWRQNFFCYFT